MSTKATKRALRWRQHSGKKRVEIYLDPAFYQTLSIQARQRETPLAEWIRELLTRAVPPLESPPSTPPALLAILFNTNLTGERKQALVEYARRLQEEGLTQAQIADRWTAEGIPTLRWQKRSWTWKNVGNVLSRYGKADRD